MKTFFEEYGYFIVSCIVGFILLAFTVHLMYGNEIITGEVPHPKYYSAGSNKELADRGTPDIALTATAVSVFKNDQSFNTIDLIESAEDAEGNDLTSEVEINDHSFDITKEGIYAIVFSVKDSRGIIGKKKAFVTVISAPIVEDENLPVITLTRTYLTLSQGASFNGANYIQSAYDVDGNNLTGNVTINTTSVNMSVAGSYIVEYSVTDSQGRVGTAYLSLTVN